MDRRYPSRPMVGVGAIIFRDDRVLLVRRGGRPSYGKWSIPGGLVEVGESLRDAVRREIREEVNLDVEVKDLVAALDRVVKDKDGKVEYHYVLLDFLCESREGEPTAASDALDCFFARLDDLPLEEMTSGSAEVIRRARSRLESDFPPLYDAAL